MEHHKSKEYYDPFREMSYYKLDCPTEEEQFRFVEFKTNAYGNSEQAVRDTFDKAVGQLTETIKVFEDKLEEVSIQFKDSITLCCHIVTSQRFPKSKAIKQEYQINFADENNIPLYFSEKTYWESVEELQPVLSGDFAGEVIG